MAVPFQLSPDGQELHFGPSVSARSADAAATNHLNPFAFTEAIMPKLLASPAPRAIVVSSAAFNLSPVRFDDLDFGGGQAYEKWQAYGQSKSANAMHAKGLAKHHQGLRAFAMTPGVNPSCA